MAEKLGRNSKRNTAEGGSMQETESSITDQDVRMFEAILGQTPKGDKVMEQLKETPISYSGEQKVKHASPGTKQVGQSKSIKQG